MCDSVICVFKVRPQAHGTALKSLVNIFTKSDAHFEDQSIWAKKLFYKFKAKRLVVDSNGLGLGLVDYLVKPQIDPISGDSLPPFGVYNDPDGEYRKYRTSDTEDEALYLMKATAPINTEAYTTVQSQITSGKLKMLIPEQVARAKLLGTRQGQKMAPEERTEYLKPFTLTSILYDEMANLREENSGVNIILKQVNRRIKKDKFSALCYGLYYIKQEEDSKRQRKKFRPSDCMFFT